MRIPNAPNAGTIGQLMMTKGMTMCKSAPGSAMRTVDVPLAYMYQVFLFKESPSTWSIVGAFLVLTSVVAIVIFRDKRSDNSHGIQVSKYGGIPENDDENYEDNEVEL